jgi:hypothetical protein
MQLLPYKRDVTQKLGRVADFCALCRRATSMVLRLHGTAWHWNLIRVSAIDLAGFTKTCEDCGTARPAEEAHYRKPVRSWRRLPIAELVARTQPNLAQKYAARLELEARLLVAPELLTPAERAALIREPFDVLAPNIQDAFRSRPWDAPAIAAVVFMFAAPFLGMWLASILAPANTDAIGWSAAGGFFLGVVATIVLAFTSPGRYLRRRALPRIARALRPLDPSPEELTVALAQQGHPFGKPVHLAWMLAALADAAR